MTGKSIEIEEPTRALDNTSVYKTILNDFLLQYLLISVLKNSKNHVSGDDILEKMDELKKQCLKKAQHAKNVFLSSMWKLDCLQALGEEDRKELEKELDDSFFNGLKDFLDRYIEDTLKEINDYE